MRTVLHRQALTANVLTRLQDLGYPVGLCDTPPDSGWSGQPGKAGSRYRPFAVLNPGPASVSEGSLAASSSEWRLPYVLTSYGADPVQTEMLADRVRQQLADHIDSQFSDGPSTWRIHHVGQAAIGAITRYEGYDPPIWGQTDTFMIWLTKES